MQKLDGKTLLDEIHDHTQAQAQYHLFDDDEHREEVEHTAKAAMTAAKDCTRLGRVYRHAEGLNWEDFDKFAPGNN